MNAINHAATALVIKRIWPGLPLVPVLIAVQFVEMLWVVFNLTGVEVTTTEPQVRAVNDIHLAYMPFSHSLVATAVLAFSAWFVVARLLHRPAWGLAFAAAVASHIVLDLAVHVPDIAIAPGMATPKFGSGLYGVPLLALAVETLYGVFCWWLYQGSRALLAAIVLLNVAAVSFYSAFVPGPEHYLAGRPQLFAAFIGLHIIIGWIAIGYFARPHWHSVTGEK